jgi:hypothetical protein
LHFFVKIKIERKEQKESNVNISSIISKYDISIRRAASLLEVTPAAIVYWKKNNKGEIPAAKIVLLEKIVKIVSGISVANNVSEPDVVNALLDLKGTPLWKGWEVTSRQFLEVNINGNCGLKDRVLAYVRKKPKAVNKKSISDVFPMALINDEYSSNYIDAYLKDSMGSPVAVCVFDDKLDAANVAMLLGEVTRIREQVEKVVGFVVVARECSPGARAIMGEIEYLEIYIFQEEVSYRLDRLDNNA